MKLNFLWKENKAQYQTGESLYLNRIRVASYGWNSAMPRDDPDKDKKRWSGNISLPSLKKESVYGASADKVKTKIEKITASWFAETLAEGKAKS